MYAVISSFSHSAYAGLLAGFAAPAAGRYPAAVELWGGDRLIATAAATRFSPEAHAAGRRHGWCGFVMAGAGEAFAVADDATLRCAASGEVLARLSVNALYGQPVVHKRLSLVDMMAHARRNNCASEVEQVLPFAAIFHRRVGREEFLEKTFAMVLHREIGFKEALLLTHLRGDEPPATILKRIATMREFSANAMAYIPGPFHPEFCYGHEAFDTD